ncbi:carbamoyl phosphate synthase-like protein, partial [Candidatus Magnetoovum chiemensis]
MTKGVRKIENIKELELEIDKNRDLIIQEYVQKDEYTADVFCDEASRVISVVPRKRINVFGGESFIGKTHYDAYLIEKTAQLANTLKLVYHNT